VGSVGKESCADPAAGGRMAPERIKTAAVRLHASGSSYKSIKISVMFGTLKLGNALFQRRTIIVNTHSDAER